MIVVATDGSDQALAAMRIALEVAAHGGDEILVTAVWTELRATLGFPVGVDTDRAWAEEAAAATAALAEQVGLEPATSIRQGAPGREICAAARDHDARLIVIGSRGFGALTGAMLGSVSGYVLRHAPCPVLVVRAAGDGMKSRDVHRSGTASTA